MANFDQHNADNLVSMLGAMVVSLTFAAREHIDVNGPHKLLKALFYEYAEHDNVRTEKLVEDSAEYAAEFGPGWLGIPVPEGHDNVAEYQAIRGMTLAEAMQHLGFIPE